MFESEAVEGSMASSTNESPGVASLETLWDSMIRVVKNSVSSATFDTLFREATPVTLHGNTLLISVPSAFTKDWIEKKYSRILTSAARKEFGKDLSVDIIVSEKESRVEQPSLLGDAKAGTMTGNNRAVFNPRHTFESFVVGNSNRFAYAAAVAVAEEPGAAYNPLFLYGGVGLGKTHLLHAIANYVTENHERLRVRYVTSEKFTNDFIQAVMDKSIIYFQKKYRETDILLIDDIQFLQGKEQTQEEFFHTFNTLYEAGKQIVISSDRPPRQLSALEDRLRSRFEMGLLTDIQPPDLETRVAILRKKAEIHKTNLPDDVAITIAEKITTNIRELEGALNRVIAYSKVERRPLDLDLVSHVLKDTFAERMRRPVTISEIQNIVCSYFGISKTALVGSKRTASIVYPRQIAMYLCKELTDESLPEIGRQFGGRDHSTVLHSCNKIEKLMKERRETLNQLNELTRMIKERG
jgi:chromosomal replication initiator protein